MKNTKLMVIVAGIVAALNVAAAQDTDGAATAERALADAKRQVESQKAELDKAAKTTADSKTTMKLAQANAGEQKAFTQRLAGIVRRGSAPVRALIIPKDASDAKSLTEVEEDLNVMAHILDKAGSDDKGARAMGISVFSGIPGSAPQNLYIEGYGAIFFLNVNFPLQPPVAKDGESEAKEKPESEWDQARREISGGGRGGSGESFSTFEEHFIDLNWSGKPGFEYNAERVEDLKKDLIAALKNAAHIRKLKNDETITVVVTGANPVGASRIVKSAGGGGGGSAGGANDYQSVKRAASNDGKTASSTAKLILRVRKADTETFQNGKLNADEFRKKVNVMLY